MEGLSCCQRSLYLYTECTSRNDHIILIFIFWESKFQSLHLTSVGTNCAPYTTVVIPQIKKTTEQQKKN